jgi:hypothetical protein
MHEEAEEQVGFHNKMLQSLFSSPTSTLVRSVKPRGPRWVGKVACTRGKNKSFQLESVVGKDHLKDECEGWRIILKQILKNCM